MYEIDGWKSIEVVSNSVVEVEGVKELIRRPCDRTKRQ